MCPQLVDTQQLAELYGVWQLVKWAQRRKISQFSMLQDNMQAVWGTLNLISRAVFWKQNRALRGVVLRLRDAGIFTHVHM